MVPLRAGLHNPLGSDQRCRSRSLAEHHSQAESWLRLVSACIDYRASQMRDNSNGAVASVWSNALHRGRQGSLNLRL